MKLGIPRRQLPAPSGPGSWTRIQGAEAVPGIGGIDCVCRIFSRSIYRALGVEDIRHRRTASEAVLMRRLLSLDYMLEHPMRRGQGWSTAPESSRSGPGRYSKAGQKPPALPDRS